MNDNYRAVFDAVRTRFGRIDPAYVVQGIAAMFNMGDLRSVLQDSAWMIAAEMQRPSVLMRPAISRDGGHWCALYGGDLMNGVAGFGDTPEDAMRDFDKNWREERIMRPKRSAGEGGG